MSTDIVTVTDQDFDQQVLQSDLPVLVDSGPSGADPATWSPRWWRSSRPTRQASSAWPSSTSTTARPRRGSSASWASPRSSCSAAAGNAAAWSGHTARSTSSARSWRPGGLMRW